MQKIINFLKTSLLGGVLVVAPAWLALLLFAKLLVKLEVFVKPVSASLPSSVGHPIFVAIALVIVVCFLVGAAIRTVIGRRARQVVERTILEKVPGYGLLRNVAQQMTDTQSNRGFKPALVEVEEALAPGFIVEDHEAEGLCTVFLPSAPTPMAGSIYIIDRARVYPVDVPVTTMFSCITKWGTGSAALLAAMQKKPLGKPPASSPAKQD